MINIYQYGSSLSDENNSRDYDLFIVSDRCVDICLHTPESWDEYKLTGNSTKGHRVIIAPPKKFLFPENHRRVKWNAARIVGGLNIEPTLIVTNASFSLSGKTLMMEQIAIIILVNGGNGKDFGAENETMSRL